VPALLEGEEDPAFPRLIVELRDPSAVKSVKSHRILEPKILINVKTQPAEVKNFLSLLKSLVYYKNQFITVANSRLQLLFLFFIDFSLTVTVTIFHPAYFFHFIRFGVTVTKLNSGAIPNM